MNIYVTLHVIPVPIVKLRVYTFLELSIFIYPANVLLRIKLCLGIPLSLSAKLGPALFEAEYEIHKRVMLLCKKVRMYVLETHMCIRLLVGAR